MVSGSSLPAVSGEKLYSNPMIPWLQLCVSIGQLGPFFGIFFGQKGPDGEWPHAWWSFCFFGNFFSSFHWFGSNQVYKVIRTAESVTFKNLYGGIIDELSLKDIESVTEESGCCGKYLSVTKIDAVYEQQREQAGRCKCCVSKSICFQLSKDSYAAFVQDHGLSSGTVIGSQMP